VQIKFGWNITSWIGNCNNKSSPFSRDECPSDDDDDDDVNDDDDDDDNPRKRVPKRLFLEISRSGVEEDRRNAENEDHDEKLRR